MASKATKATLCGLPAEMVCEVLRWLFLADLIRFKMTAKRYLQIVSDFRVKQLNVGVYAESNSIDHCHLNLFVLQFARPILSHLQRLTIDVYPKQLDLNELNRFHRLVQLKIRYELPEGDQVHFTLPELKQLEVTWNRTRKMRISSTKLEKLIYYGDENLLQVEHPETVFALDSCLTGNLLRSFRNLRQLHSSSNLRILDERSLSDFPDLKEIAYTGTIVDVYHAFVGGSQGWEDIDELSPFLKRFMARKKALGRANLKVEFIMFELVDHKAIDDYKIDEFFLDLYDKSHGSFNLDDFYLQNLSQLIVSFPTRYPNDFGRFQTLYREIMRSRGVYP